MSYSAISSDLGVNVTSLFLVEVDLSLQDINLLGLTLKLLLEDVLLHLIVLFLFFVLVVEDLLVGAIQLPIQRELLVTKISDKIQEVGVSLDGLGQVSLGSGKISLSFLLLSVAFLLHLLELILQIKDNLGRSANLKSFQWDDVSETEEHSLVVLTLPLFHHLLFLVDVILLLLSLQLSFMLSLLQLFNLFIQLEFSVDQLKQLSPGE